MRSLSLVLICAVAGVCACSSNSPSPDGGLDGGPDGGNGSDAGDTAAGALLPFKASNLDLTGIDLSQIADEDTTSSCQIRTGISDCWNHAAFHTAMQSDGSNLTIIVVKSWKVEPTAHVTLTAIAGNTPIAIVSLGDMTIMGTIDGHGLDVHASPGGFESIAGQDGSGPGGGPKGTSALGAGGASYCGQGGSGSVVMMSGGTPPAKAAASGTPEIVPLRGGASGGGGGSQGGGGGAGLQLVAGGKFTMLAGSYINLGGGGGGGGVTAGGGAAGGALLVEARSISVAGIIAVNGGGGGGAGLGLDNGKNGTADAMAAAGGPGKGMGGNGSAGATIDGADAPAPLDTGIAGGGGGGAGRIRFNSKSGAADLAAATLSPPSTTPCVSEGVVK
jgi:hypothetical protein